MKKENAKSIEGQLAKHGNRIFHAKTMNSENPMIRASYIWSIISSQLQVLLEDAVYRKWFSSIAPLVISDNVLILQSKNRFHTFWVNRNYQELVDVLLQALDPKLSSFFLSPSDIATERDIL